MSGTTNSLVEIANYLQKKNKDAARQVISQLEQKYYKVVNDLYATEEKKEKGKAIISGIFQTLKSFTSGDFNEVGEKLTRLIERGTEGGWPVIIISTSGGARMYEGMFSLMQMAKTSAALAYHAQRRLPYISILVNPDYAGVMASYASLGDLILAEPKAMIGFAGPRVIKDTTQAELPPGFQTSEFLLDHGLIDSIVHRKEMKEQLVKYLDYFAAGHKHTAG